MQKLKILNKRETEKIIEALKKQFGFSGEMDYVFLLSEKNKIYIVNKGIEKIDVSGLRVNSYGLYIGELRDSIIRLSIEGSQLIGPASDKNVLELDDKQAKEWLQGYDLTYDGNLNGYVIIRNRGDFLGCGRAASGKILNHVPKIRRLNTVN